MLFTLGDIVLNIFLDKATFCFKLEGWGRGDIPKYEEINTLNPL